MQHLEVSGAVRHIYIYVIRRLRVNLMTRQNVENYLTSLGSKDVSSPQNPYLKHCSIEL